MIFHLCDCAPRDGAGGMTNKDVSLNRQNQCQPVRGGVEQLESKLIKKIDIENVDLWQSLKTELK